ncbi:MAG TPA: hypothetical protein VM327_03790 [Candidatus Thermoplasmatota archaeon]|nr:hypothetical protein [Candidatus Thermoplasmatota archaeon]
MNREWAIPAALGLVVAAALLAVPHKGDDGDRPDTADPSNSGSSSAADPHPTILLPFTDSWGMRGGETTHILVAPQGKSAALDGLNASGMADFAGEFAWRGDKLALYTNPNLFTGCQSYNGSDDLVCSDPIWAAGSGGWPLPRTYALPDNDTGARLGLDGYNGTRATIYVFDERGLLAATNDAPGNWSRFAGSPTTMESAVWYIGANGTAPNGTQKPPSFAMPFVQRLRPLMEGLPVGGVASTQSNAYVSLYGTLFITIRIDGLVYAP